MVMAVNKLPDKPVEARIALDGIGSHKVQVYQFDAEHTQIRRLADARVENSRLSYTVPPYSATLLVVEP